MEPGASGQADLVQRIGFPIHQSRGWLKLLGVVSILSGILMVFTILGIVIAWLPIWLGVLLYQSAELVDRAYTSGDERTLIASLSKLKLYFIISGIMSLIGVAFMMILMSLGMLGAVARFAASR
jgi:Family of unknown function (DUF5362)